MVDFFLPTKRRAFFIPSAALKNLTFTFFRSNGHEPIVAAPPLECPGAPWSAKRLKIYFQTFHSILSRWGLVCENIEYLWIFSDFHLAQEFNHEYIRWGGRLHIAMILSDASSLKIWWRLKNILHIHARNYLKRKIRKGIQLTVL